MSTWDRRNFKSSEATARQSLSNNPRIGRTLSIAVRNQKTPVHLLWPNQSVRCDAIGTEHIAMENWSVVSAMFCIHMCDLLPEVVWPFDKNYLSLVRSSISILRLDCVLRPDETTSTPNVSLCSTNGASIWKFRSNRSTNR